MIYNHVSETSFLIQKNSKSDRKTQNKTEQRIVNEALFYTNIF